MHIVLVGAALTLLFALLINGIFFLVTKMWWLLLLLLVATGARLYFRHPGVRLKRELRRAAKRGEEQRADIREVTAQAKAEMEQIARQWERWR